ncbi:hypothetical protein HOLleu_42119 [Holothuria leucospilota]|uniref:Uncharacterized protein n=1 Tax=Holothuria leucospilota TaxID=206669 RepID=A0A9Q0YB63_HOLLE|nr:hypothetical protein HOLleu_42119 [Holothuria leucospilota]
MPLNIFRTYTEANFTLPWIIHPFLKHCGNHRLVKEGWGVSCKVFTVSLDIIQDSRYSKQDGWWLNDISLCSNGNIAVSGSSPYKSYVSIYGSTVGNSDSIDKPTLLYHKQFTDKDYWPPWRPRCISFMIPNSTEIVTCQQYRVQVIDYIRDVVLRSRKVNGITTCLAVSESQIFIGLRWSDIVNIYDNDLNEIKSIRLKGIRDDWPWDIAAADRLYVRTVYHRAIVYSQDSGSIVTEYTTVQDRSWANSIAVNIELGLTAVLWNQGYPGQKKIAFYLLAENKSFLNVNVKSGVSTIRISHEGRIVAGNESSGEVKIYNLLVVIPRFHMDRAWVPMVNPTIHGGLEDPTQ